MPPLHIEARVDPDRWQPVLLPLLATLGAAAEPVTFDLLCTFAGVEVADEQWRAMLDGPWRPFLQVQYGPSGVQARGAVGGGDAAHPHTTFGY